MGALTANRPKPLIQVSGRALLDYAIDIAVDAGVEKVVVNTHYKAEMIAAHLADTCVTISHEPEILETGGGLRNACNLLDSKATFTLNSDAIWSGPNPLKVLKAAWDPDKMDALLLCLPIENVVGRVGAGDFSINADGHVYRGGSYVYSGAQIIKPSTTHSQPDGAFSTNVVWDELIAKKRLYACLYDGKQCDIGRPEGIKLGEDLLAAARTNV